MCHRAVPDSYELRTVPFCRCWPWLCFRSYLVVLRVHFHASVRRTPLQFVSTEEERLLSGRRWTELPPSPVNTIRGRSFLNAGRQAATRLLSSGCATETSRFAWGCVTA